MTATNHTLTGIIIGLSITNPIIALPVAFVSHFVLDVLPHFGERNNLVAAFSRLKFILPLDMLLDLGMLLTVLTIQPPHWQLGIASGITAASPDLWSIPIFVHFLNTGKVRKQSDWFYKFHHMLQWGERLWGAWIELAWFTVMGAVLLHII